MTDHTDLIARLRDFAEEPHANLCLQDAACTCGHDVSRVALAHEAATALEALARENAGRASTPIQIISHNSMIIGLYSDGTVRAVALS